jgi:hypothetical protein
MDIMDRLVTVKPLIRLFLVLGRMIIKNKINETIRNVINIGLNNVNAPKVSNDSNVYMGPP